MPFIMEHARWQSHLPFALLGLLLPLPRGQFVGGMMALIGSRQLALQQ